jgi:glycosyltransferase involved in cell wall biosynthesis
VLTVLDLQHEFFPEFFSRRDLLLRRLRWQPSARAADHVIAISEFSRRTVCERYGIAPERVTSVPLAARSSLVPDPATPLPKELTEDDRWLFYPASPLGAKNHGRLLEALALVADRDAKLVLTGPTMHSWAAVDARIAELGLGERVVRLGHVSEAELVNLYARANGLIFPSLFEGFGLPVIEAMANGCPAAVADAASLPEIAGEAGRTFDPTDVEQIAAAMDWLLGLAGPEREAVAAAGRAQAAKFSVETMTEGTVGVYRKLVHGA